MLLGGLLTLAISSSGETPDINFISCDSTIDSSEVVRLLKLEPEGQESNFVRVNVNCENRGILKLSVLRKGTLEQRSIDVVELKDKNRTIALVLAEMMRNADLTETQTSRPETRSSIEYTVAVTLTPSKSHENHPIAIGFYGDAMRVGEYHQDLWGGDVSAMYYPKPWFVCGGGPMLFAGTTSTTDSSVQFTMGLVRASVAARLRLNAIAIELGPEVALGRLISETQSNNATVRTASATSTVGFVFGSASLSLANVTWSPTIGARFGYAVRGAVVREDQAREIAGIAGPAVSLFIGGRFSQ